MNRFKFYFFLLLTGLAALVFTACDEDEGPGALPTVSLSQNAASGVPGAQVSTTVTITAPEGAKTLKIFKNGASVPAFPDVALNNQPTATQTFNYTIETLTAGTVVNFSFQVIDALDRPSQLSSFAVTVTAVPPKPIVDVTGNITANTTWTKGNIYRLKGFVRVGTDPTRDGTPTATATLTIEPGTVIIGERATKGTLIVHRGSRLIANGTATEPIIFTSERPAGEREPGDWGGIVLCGRAANNNPGGTAELEGQYGAFHGGGASPANDDNSGSLRYVRIEYAGVPINPNQEINSLTMGSVGSATVIEYVVASFGLDDAFEWFGGTVNGKYLVSNRTLDDDFDVDNGYSGKVQFALAIRGASLSDQSGSNGFEVDNDGGGTTNEPFTSGSFSNVTIIGPKKTRESAIAVQFQNALHLRRSNKLKIYNSFFTGFPNGVLVDGPNTVNFAGAGDLVMRANVLAGVENWGGNGFGSAGTIFTGAPANGANHPNAPRGVRVGASASALGSSAFVNGIWQFTPAEIGGKAAEAWFTDNNALLDKWQDAGINANVFDIGTPTLLPNAGSVLLSGANFTGLTGFTEVTYRGAFGATDWTSGWINWNPSLTSYR